MFSTDNNTNNNDNLNTPGVVITWTKGEANTNLRHGIMNEFPNKNVASYVTDLNNNNNNNIIIIYMHL